MKKTRIIMGMPISVEIVGTGRLSLIDKVFDYFKEIDDRYSTYKPSSEISKINDGLPEKEWSEEVREVLRLCEETSRLTNGFFDIRYNGKIDPSGLVKGWAIYNAALLLEKNKVQNFYIDAGGDLQVHGLNGSNQPWAIGIRNPFNLSEIIKVVNLKNQGMATSGNYIRGEHIYDPHRPKRDLSKVKSLTVIADNVYEADRFATAAFAMGEEGIKFIESKLGLEAYMVTADQVATLTSGFSRYAADV